MSATPAETHFPDADAASAWLAGEIAALLRQAIARRGVAALALSGGRSPVPLMQRLAAAGLDWPRVLLTLVDERWVDPASPDSNERLLREHLLIGPAAAARFVPLKSPAASPQAALAERGAAIGAMPLPFDAVVLGMGEDGHTASLFPGAAGLAAALDPGGTALLAAIDPPAAPHPRLSLTLAAILRARRIYLPIQGTAKRAVYARARAGASPLELPVAAVLGQQHVPVQVCIAAA